MRLLQVVSDASQRHRRRVFYLSELIQYRIDAAQHGREGYNTFGQSVQRGVWILHIALRSLLGTTLQVANDVYYCFQRATQIPHLILLQMGVLQAYARDALAYIKEILHGKIVVLLTHTAELAHLRQPFVYYISIGRESHFVYFLLSKSALATCLQQSSNLIESELSLKVIWINHAAKVLIFRQKQAKSQKFYKKLAKNLFVSKKLRTFAPAFRQRRALERW